jgi:hypothetical protein
LERTGTVYAGQTVFEKIPDEIDIIYNRSHAVVSIADLGMIVQPHQVVKLSKFFTKERISASQGLQIAISKLRSIVPVALENVAKLDVSAPKSKLEKLEEENKDVIPSVDSTGTKIPIDSLTGGDNPMIEAALENEAIIEKANKEMIQGATRGTSAQDKLNEIHKKKERKAKAEKVEEPKENK